MSLKFERAWREHCPPALVGGVMFIDANGGGPDVRLENPGDAQTKRAPGGVPVCLGLARSRADPHRQGDENGEEIGEREEEDQPRWQEG